MNEIEKMYENAGIEKIELDYPDNFEPFYPEFTAEKQLKLIKWLILNDFVDELDIFYRPFELMWVFKIYNVPEFANEKSACRMGADMTFEKGLASLINNLWQSLTKEEKQQVKGILE